MSSTNEKSNGWRHDRSGADWRGNQWSTRGRTGRPPKPRGKNLHADQSSNVVVPDGVERVNPYRPAKDNVITPIQRRPSRRTDLKGMKWW